MNFSLTKEQEYLRNHAVKFAKTKLNVNLIESDKESRFSERSWKMCADFGIQGMFVPKRWGGLGLDFISGVLIMEGLGYGCKDNGLLFSINAHIWGCVMPILHFGTDYQRKKYLRGLCKGDLIGAYAATELDAGSDVFSMKTTAVKKGDNYILNGAKIFITNAPVADIVLVFAKVVEEGNEGKISCFIVEKGFPGFSVGKKIEKMGLRTSPFGELIFQECVVPERNLLGKVGMGKMIFSNVMEHERAFIMATQVGAMERQLEECFRYAKTRKQFGKKILEFESVSNMLADMKVRVVTSRLLLYKLAWLKQRKKKFFIDSSIAKLYISECCVKNSFSALRIFGGYGYTTEYEIERQLRDSIGGLLYSGTSEIQRYIIANLLDLEYKVR